MPIEEGQEIEGFEGFGELPNAIEEELGNLGIMPSRNRTIAARNIAQRTKPAIRKANAQGAARGYQKGKTSATVATSISGSMTAKGWFELKKAELPKAVQDGLANKSLQVVDANIYAIKPIEGKSVVDLLTSSDDKAVGKCNINGAKLDIEEHFLLTEIRLDYGTFAAGETAADTVFGKQFPAQILNGEFELKVGAETLLPENLSCEIFNNESNTSENVHVFKLANPKWIKPQMEIKPRLTLTSAGVVGEAVKMTLGGCRVHKK